ncbi:MAG: prepilin-type N-terminal cleavage/methylation domain-containing protein [Gemmatimonadota bacterium]
MHDRRPIPLDRRGMTLVELLVAMVAAGLVMVAVYQVLLTNQRVYTVQREQILGHQTVRAGADVLFGELRELSAREGDILNMAEGEVEVRAMRSFGFVCGTNPSQSRIAVAVRGRAFAADQTAFVFVDNDPESTADDAWATSPINSVSDDSGACAAAASTIAASLPIQVLNVSGLTSGDFAGLRLGAPVRSSETFTYGVFQDGGEWYLGRRAGAATAVPLVGPLEGEGGLTFEYFDGAGTVTTTPAAVRRIRVTLRTASEALDQGNNAITDELTTDVFLRN